MNAVRPAFRGGSSMLYQSAVKLHAKFETSQLVQYLFGYTTQVPSCLAADIPDDCPQKFAGPCAPVHSGMFEVVNKPMVLHVHPDVQNAMSCMIQAQGVIMGCSTFGQIAGLFTQGISLFSTQCGGERTPVQYKSIPPLAVAEMGYLWVPIAGSWRDPVLISKDLFRGALDTLLSGQQAASNARRRGLAASAYCNDHC